MQTVVMINGNTGAALYTGDNNYPTHNDNTSAPEVADRLAKNIVLDTMQSGLERAGVRLSQETRDALQDMRDLINGNQDDAAQQCGHRHRPHRPRCPSDPCAPLGQKEGPLTMLMLLLMILEKLMAHRQDNCEREPDFHIQDGSKSQPQDSNGMRELGKFFWDMGVGFETAGKKLAAAAWRQ